LVLAAYDYPEYLSFVNTIRNGSNQYKLQVIPVNIIPILSFLSFFFFQDSNSFFFKSKLQLVL